MNVLVRKHDLLPAEMGERPLRMAARDRQIGILQRQSQTARGIAGS